MSKELLQADKASALNKLLFKLDDFMGSGVIPWQIEDAYADYVAAIAQPVPQATDRNFCERCGQRAGVDYIHTCTPPKGAEQ